MNEDTLQILQALVRSARGAEARLDSLLAGHDLSATRLWALERLDQADDPLSPGQLAGCMAFARSNATQLIDHLETSSLVERVPDPQDRRSMRLAVTDLGRQNCAEARATLQPLIEQIEKNLNQEERKTLANLLQRLSEAFK